MPIVVVGVAAAAALDNNVDNKVSNDDSIKESV